MNSNSLKHSVFVYACVPFLFNAQAAVQDATTPAVTIQVERLPYEAYMQRIQQRIARLRETVAMASNVQDKASAYAFIDFIDAGGNNPYFYLDGTALNAEQQAQFDTANRKAKALNAMAFIAAREACRRVVKAQGYGDDTLFSYYDEKLRELAGSTPL